MAAKKVQGYLDHHRIGPLFEDLMAKLIKVMPDQPIPFLIKTLNKLHPEGSAHSIPHSRPPSGSRTRSPMSNSIGLTGKTMTRHSFDDSISKRSSLAKSWAAPDSFSADAHHGRPMSASKATREYERPWLTGSTKKAKGREDHAHSNKENTRQGFKTHVTSEKVPWNSKTKLPSHDFDEMFELQNKMGKGEETKAKEYHGAQSWDDSQDFDSSMDKRGLGYPLHIKRKTLESPDVNTDDGLEGEEFRLPRDMKTAGDSSEGNSVMSYSSLRSHKNKAKTAAEEHRKQLQSLLQNTNRSCRSEHHGKLSDDDMDDATEILESSNELESEGVANPSKTGARLMKSSRSGSSSNEPVKVSICARCARIIAGLPSDQTSEAGSTSFNSAADEDFESVSQAGSVTDGPRRITWPSGFDSESEATAKKGRPMWQSSSPQPDKGKHMYRNSTFLTETASPRRPQSAFTDDVSDDGLFSKPVSRRQYGGYSSDNETETNYHRTSSPDLSKGRPWSRPPPDSASEADSVDWIQERSKNRGVFESRGFRRSEMTDDSDQ